MIGTPASRARTLIFSGVLLAACRLPGREAEPVAPLPAIPVYVITPTDSAGLVLVHSPGVDPGAPFAAQKRVTLTASNADARTLLLWLAQEAGVSLVVSPDVTARVSVSFNAVPAGDAMRAILAEAKLSVLASGLNTPWPPVVFFQMPMNINEASADAIAARFGVSLEMAKWLVESRNRP